MPSSKLQRRSAVTGAVVGAALTLVAGCGSSAGPHDAAASAPSSVSAPSSASAAPTKSGSPRLRPTGKPTSRGAGAGASAGAGAAAPGDTARTLKLALPQTLPGGYAQQSSTVDEPVLGGDLAITDGTVYATYAKGSDAQGDIAVEIGGSFGSIVDPAQFLKEAGDEITNGGNVTWQGRPTPFDARDPKDPSAKLECGLTTQDEPDLPVCIWAGHSTGAFVNFINATAPGSATRITLAQAADLARTIRDTAVVAR